MYTKHLQAAIDEFGRLPGIGPKSAQRIAFFLLKMPGEDAKRLAASIVAVKEHTTLCTRCFNVADSPDLVQHDSSVGEEPKDETLCPICSDPRREAATLCVVEDPRDIVAMERTNQYRGRYHVLGGALSPLDGIGPEELRVKELMGRISSEEIEEVIICTNPNLEGETTSMYLAKVLEPMQVKVTRLASGLPAGGDLEYADALTLLRAFEGRREVTG